MLRSLVTFLSLGGTAGALTWLFLGMRAVMAVGGSCGSGDGPYVVAQPCPHGVPVAILGGIFGGMICLAVYAIFGLPFGPRLVLLAWPALFLSLGYNFLRSGLDGSGAGWLCAILFFLMGGVPLLFLLNRRALARTFASGTPEEAPDRIGMLSTVGVLLRPMARARTAPAGVPSGVREGHRQIDERGIVSPGSDSGQPDDLSHALARIAALHSAGALTDEEFTVAKQRLLDTVAHEPLLTVAPQDDEDGGNDHGVEAR